MSTLALNLARAVAEARQARPGPRVKSIINCPICGKPISAANCKPIMQSDGEWNRLEFAASFGGSAPATTKPRKPAELFPVGHFVEDELRERGWSRSELAFRIGGPVDINRIAIDLLIDAPTKGMLIGRDMAEDLARVFETSVELWLDLDAAWQRDTGLGTTAATATPATK